MIYPKSLKDSDTIGIIAPSNGIVNESKIKALNKAEKNLVEYGFKISESKDVRKSILGASNTALCRAKDLLGYILNDEIDAVITATGGDFLVEILEYTDFNNILQNVKWIQGQSDTTAMLYVLTTGFDIATIYSYNITGFGYEEMQKAQINNIKILKGEMITQDSVSLRNTLTGEKIIEKENKAVLKGNRWKSIRGEKEIIIKGRIIGGCLDCLLDIVGTKFDYTKEFINRYADEQIIWYFDVSDLPNESILRGLWQLKNAGWFQNARGIMFGRIKNEVSYTGISLNEAISRGINNEDIVVFTNVDLGHTEPRMTIINGAVAVIEYNEGIGKIKLDLI